MLKRKRRSHRIPLDPLPGLSLCLIAAVVAAFACARQVPPNVLIITVDTLRVDHLGCYGFSKAHTPNIDALAAGGVRCTNAAAVAPITLPSHCSIMTGLYPPAHGVRDNGAYALGEDTVTLAERLRSAGYATKAVVSAVILNRRYNLSKGFDDYDDNLWAEDEPKLFMVRDRKAARTVARFLTWLDAWARPPSRKPFFAWVHFYDPHAPYEPPAEDAAITPSAYDGEISSVDRAVGKLIAKLKEKGLLDRTLLILTADHGESLGEHGEKTHALFIYDATIRVPLIWRYPGVFPAGKTYSGPVSSVDIVPTVLRVLGLPGGDQTQGIDLLRPLEGKTPAPERPQYCESLTSEVGFGMAPLVGLRKGGFKWIRAPRSEVYDLRADPHELHNIIVSNQATATRLDRELEAILADSQRHAHKANPNPMDRETMQSLRSLGYLAGPEERASMGGIDPKDGIGIYNELESARHFCQRHRWKHAERLLRRILTQVPTHLTARNILALTLTHQGRFTEAEAQYRGSLQQDPKQFRVYAALSTLEMLQGDLDSAQRNLERSLELTPHFVEAICNLGFIAALRGDDAKAREWYEKAIAEDPGFPRVYRRIADLYFDGKDYASALRYYGRTLQATPDDFPAIIQSGNCARRTGNPAIAKDYFERAAKLRPDSWIPLYNLGCLAAVGDLPESAAHYLAGAVAKGFKDDDLFEHDRDWDAIRGDPKVARAAQDVKRAALAAGRDVAAENE